MEVKVMKKCTICGSNEHLSTKCSEKKDLISPEYSKTMGLIPPSYPKTAHQRQLAIARHLKSNKQQLLKRCHAVLKKRSKARTDLDLQLIVDFTATNAFFQDKFEHVGYPYHIELCRRITHRNCKFNEVIIKQGDIGDEFYIIISGSIRIELVKELFGEKQRSQVLVTLGPGDSFGELALLNEEPRAASCIVSSLKCELMVIKKIDFQEILQKSHIKTLIQRTRFLRQIPLFRTLKPDRLVVVASHMSKRMFHRHEIIIKEDTHAEGVYIITKGIAKVYKRCDDTIIQLNILQKGEIFGELGVILPGSNRTASVIAESTKVECLELSRSDFFESLSQYQDLMLDECLSRYPTDIEIINEIKLFQLWNKYKMSVMNEIQDQKDNLNTFNINKRNNVIMNRKPIRPPNAALRGRNGLKAIAELRKNRRKEKNKKKEVKNYQYYKMRGKKYNAGKVIVTPSNSYTTERTYKNKRKSATTAITAAIRLTNMATFRGREEQQQQQQQVIPSSSSSSSDDDEIMDDDDGNEEEENYLKSVRRNTRHISFDVSHLTSKGTNKAFTHVLRHAVGKRFARRLSLKVMEKK